MIKNPKGLLIPYLMISGSLLSGLSIIKIPTVTLESFERSIVTQVCNGDNKPSPYALVLLAIASGNFLLAGYLLFPKQYKNFGTRVICFINEEDSDETCVRETQQIAHSTESIDQSTAMDVTYLKASANSAEVNSASATTTIQESETLVQGSVSENQILMELLKSKVPNNFPETWLKIIYLAILKCQQKEKVLLIGEVLKYFEVNLITSDLSFVEGCFLQLEELGYGKVFKTPDGRNVSGFLLGDLIDG